MAGAFGKFQQSEEIKLNKDMEYMQFLGEIRERVEAHFNGKVTGEVCTSTKNNGVNVTGLMLKSEEERVAPNFYLESQFIEWMRGLRTLEEISEKLCDAYKEEIDRSRNLLSEIRFSWEEFQDNVFLRLINQEKNKELLETIPHRKFLDLAVVYYYSVRISNDVAGSMVITKEHLNLLGITEEELYVTAKNNGEKFQPVRIRCMEDLLYELGRKVGVEVLKTETEQPMLYVMTNTKSLFGAVSMTFAEELECFSMQIEKNFCLLPSSVHEVILVPESADFCREYFKSMVMEINATQVDATEVLSDNIYYYDRKTKQLTIC